MRNLITRSAIAVVVSVFVFFMWQSGVFLSSLMKERPPLYFELHNWWSMVGSPIIGILVALTYDK